MNKNLTLLFLFCVAGCKITASAYIEHKIDDHTKATAKVDYLLPEVKKGN